MFAAPQRAPRLLPLAVALVAPLHAGCGPSTAVEADVEVFFCPEDRCDQAILSLVEGATESIYLAMYSFNHEAIASALVAARTRGVEVFVLLEPTQIREGGDSGAVFEQLRAGGVVVLEAEGQAGIMHNKFAVFDGLSVVTGSYNFTNQASYHNDENFVLLHSEEVAARFSSKFQSLWEKYAR